MTRQPELTPGEWALVVELLQRELTELPTEIHHTHRPQYRKDLVDRRRMAERLMERLQEAVTT